MRQDRLHLECFSVFRRCTKAICLSLQCLIGGVHTEGEDLCLLKRGHRQFLVKQFLRDNAFTNEFGEVFEKPHHGRTFRHSPPKGSVKRTVIRRQCIHIQGIFLQDFVRQRRLFRRYCRDKITLRRKHGITLVRRLHLRLRIALHPLVGLQHIGINGILSLKTRDANRVSKLLAIFLRVKGRGVLLNPPTQCPFHRAPQPTNGSCKTQKVLHIIPRQHHLVKDRLKQCRVLLREIDQTQNWEGAHKSLVTPTYNRLRQRLRIRTLQEANRIRHHRLRITIKGVPQRARHGQLFQYCFIRRRPRRKPLRIHRIGRRIRCYTR